MHWLALQSASCAAQLLGAGGGKNAGGSADGGADRSADSQADATLALVDPDAALAWCALRFSPKVAWVLQDAGAGKSGSKSKGTGTGTGTGTNQGTNSGTSHTVSKAVASQAHAPKPPEEFGPSFTAAVLVLEVSASERLFGGRRALLQQISEAIGPLALIKRGQGATSLIAVGRLLAAAPGVPPASVAPDDLPLQALIAARPHLPTLARLGCQTWGQLRALPRGGVSRRFGAPLLEALDAAYGLRPEVYPWLALPEVFEQALELPSHVESASALMFGARRLLAQLQVWLQARQQGVLGLELVWQMDPRRDTATQGQLQIRTAQATLQVAHLQRLLAEHLDRVTLPSPAVGLVLRTLQTAPLAHASASLLPDEVKQGDSWHQLIERLTARLGAQQVQQLQACDDHRPERMQAWVSATPKAGAALMASAQSPKNLSASKSTAAKSNATKLRAISAGGISAAGYLPSQLSPDGASNVDALYPTWLLARPLPLAMRGDTPLYQGPLTLLVGPQRLETGWWHELDAGLAPANVAAGSVAPGSAVPQAGLAVRDYFIAKSECAGLVWVFRERLPGNGRGAGSASEPNLPEVRWQLHGFY